jgi:hypothetical protein
MEEFTELEKIQKNDEPLGQGRKSICYEKMMQRRDETKEEEAHLFIVR